MNRSRRSGAVRYVEAPTYYVPEEGDPPAVFLAGGITSVPDWQREAIAALAGEQCVVLNPRRAVFDSADPEATRKQVEWECWHRREVSPLLVMFWFPASEASVTVQPIALLELGAELARYRSPDRGLVVGADPGYPRRADVVLQCAFDAPGLVVHRDLSDTVLAAAALLRRWPASAA